MRSEVLSREEVASSRRLVEDTIVSRKNLEGVRKE
jgi:hypothetical protein